MSASRFPPRLLRRIALVVVALILLLQMIPYGRQRSTPEITGEPPWDSERTRRLFMQVCGDCHSHETRRPWYSRVAPISWLVQYDVEEARGHFNVSAWDRGHGDADEAAEEYESGEMPLWYYAMLHSDAELSAGDKEALLMGLRKTFGGEQGETGSGEEH